MEMVYKGSVVELRDASTVLTGSLVASSELSTANDSFVTLSIDYVKGGSATALTLVPEVSPTPSGDDWQPAETTLETATPAAGIVTLPAHETRYTLTATASRTLHVRVFGAQRFRVRVLETGTPGGTCRVRAVASRVGS